jgi:hypothetical protein
MTHWKSILLFSFCLFASCTYDRLQEIEPVDVVEEEEEENENPDTMDVPPIDTMDVTGILCDIDSMYFEWEILPILRSGCGRDECHSSTVAYAGLRLNNYANIDQTGGVDPFQSHESRIIGCMEEPDDDQRMPPLPFERLLPRQIDIIKEWIDLGATNLRCDPELLTCPEDSVVTFETDILPIFEDACQGCHQPLFAEAGIELITHQDILARVTDGSLLGTIRKESGYKLMPFKSVPLSPCKIQLIEQWIDDGAPNN